MLTANVAEKFSILYIGSTDYSLNKPYDSILRRILTNSHYFYFQLFLTHAALKFYGFEDIASLAFPVTDLQS